MTGVFFLIPTFSPDNIKDPGLRRWEIPNRSDDPYTTISFIFSSHIWTECYSGELLFGWRKLLGSVCERTSPFLEWSEGILQSQSALHHQPWKSHRSRAVLLNGWGLRSFRVFLSSFIHLTLQANPKNTSDVGSWILEISALSRAACRTLETYFQYRGPPGIWEEREWVRFTFADTWNDLFLSSWGWLVSNSLPVNHHACEDLKWSLLHRAFLISYWLLYLTLPLLEMD